VASFTTQTNERLDLDSETVRLLRNQLRMRSNLQVLDADVEPLGDFSEDTLEQLGILDEFKEMDKKARAEGEEEISQQEWIDLEQDKLLEDEEYWQQLGEEYQNPLIVTGKLRFGSERSRSEPDSR
jgi:glutaredoxin